ncbi:MAG: glycosyltransferase [Selenomonadaceae bacterium]|nr:glycosyltransferase [Selenomonadaceae bacterium]
MDAPKISVLIPMYNRKHYIAQAVDSVLNQTFQDFELIIRDNSSTDGSFEFVKERYAEQIFSGKIKLRRNEKNLGEFPTDNRLINEATGKYIMIFHSDDVYLPHALEHMYTLAEKYNADVVHGSTRFFTNTDEAIEAGANLTISHSSQLKRTYTDNSVNKNILVPNDPKIRFFDEWIEGGTFHDAQYNIYRTKFLTDNNISFWEYGKGLIGGNRLFTLKWLMKADVFVKTLEPFYIHRNLIDSSSHRKISPEIVAQLIEGHIELARHMKEYFASEEFFRDNEEHQYLALSKNFSFMDLWRIKRNGVYKNGVTTELNDAVEEVFRKYFGDDAAYLTFLFHWAHTLQEKKSIVKITSPPSETIQKDWFWRQLEENPWQKDFSSNF